MACILRSLKWFVLPSEAHNGLRAFFDATRGLATDRDRAAPHRSGVVVLIAVVVVVVVVAQGASIIAYVMVSFYKQR